jgi:hypothetical protein
MSCLVSVPSPFAGYLCQPSVSHQLPRLSLEEELAKRQVLAHQVYYGQAYPTLLIDPLSALAWTRLGVHPQRGGSVLAWTAVMHNMKPRTLGPTALGGDRSRLGADAAYMSGTVIALVDEPFPWVSTYD